MTAAAPRCYAVVPAAGVGRRMGADVPKQYLELRGKPVLLHTIERLCAHPAIERVVIATAADDPRFAALAPRLPAGCTAVTGGAERCHSVLAGLQRLRETAADDAWVLVHDAARPCLRAGDIDRMIDELGGGDGGGILAAPVRDTLKRCDDTGRVVDTLSRDNAWHALTPQMFRLGPLAAAIESALAAGVIVTDEAQAAERAGIPVRVVQGHADNIKITLPEDLALAGAILAAQH